MKTNKIPLEDDEMEMEIRLLDVVMEMEIRLRMKTKKLLCQNGSGNGILINKEIISSIYLGMRWRLSAKFSLVQGQDTVLKIKIKYD